MSDVYFKILALVLIFLGEALAIVAELFAAKIFHSSIRILFIGFAVVILSSAFLILGYVVGFGFFKNIWIVSVISLASILLVEPLLDFVIFRQLPTKGALIGLILGILGFASTILIK
jgi:hypothetical protein